MKCESGQLTLDVDDRKAEYRFHTDFPEVPQVLYSICDYNFDLKSNPDSNDNSTKQPHALGLFVTAYTFQDKVYELRFYSFNMKGKGDFIALHQDQEFWKLRTSLGRVMGIWQTELNGVTEFFHIAVYDDLDDLLKIRQTIADCPDFGRKIQTVVEQYGVFRNSLTILAPGSDLQTDFRASPTAVYELQTAKRSSAIDVPPQNAVLVGRFITLFGPANTEYRLIRYPDPRSSQAAATERVLKATGGEALTETRLMVPLGVSDLQ